MTGSPRLSFGPGKSNNSFNMPYHIPNTPTKSSIIRSMFPRLSISYNIIGLEF